MTPFSCFWSYRAPQRPKTKFPRNFYIDGTYFEPQKQAKSRTLKMAELALRACGLTCVKSTRLARCTPPRSCLSALRDRADRAAAHLAPGRRGGTEDGGRGEAPSLQLKLLKQDANVAKTGVDRHQTALLRLIACSKKALSRRNSESRPHAQQVVEMLNMTGAGWGGEEEEECLITLDYV